MVERAGRGRGSRGRPVPGCQLANKAGLQATSDPHGQPAYDQYDPYGPLMALFGIPSSLHAPPRLTDARVYFSLVTSSARGPGTCVVQRKLRAADSRAAGDDGVAHGRTPDGDRRRRPPGGRRPTPRHVPPTTAKSAGRLAWCSVSRPGSSSRHGPSSSSPLSLPVTAKVAGVRGSPGCSQGWAAVLVPSVLPVFVHDPTAFLNNVVRYPLGLRRSARLRRAHLPGHILVSPFPQIKRVFPFVLAWSEHSRSRWVLVRHRPRTVSDVCRLGGWVMTAGILFAPATRVGYLLYPINFFIWSWLLRSEEEAEVSLEAETVVARHQNRRVGRRAAA